MSCRHRSRPIRRTDRHEPTTQDGGGAPDLVDAALGRLRDAVDEIAMLELRGVDTGRLRRLARIVTEQAGRLEGVRAGAVREATRSGAVERSGASSGAAWLADVTGGTTTASARTVALGEAYDAVPSLADAVAEGAVGAEHAASIARAAKRGVLDGDQLDQMVADASLLPAGPFARAVRGAETRTDQRQLRRDERLARERRFADWWTTDDGSVEGRFRLDAVSGQPVITALDALTVPDPAETPDDARRTPRQRRADAVSELARRTLERGDTPVVRTVQPHVTVTVPVSMLADTDAWLRW